jgi:cell wall-associated NlpC family hydrolase
MRKLVFALVGLLCATSVIAMVHQGTPESAQDVLNYADRLKTVIENHLGRPYVWGASGLKSFDCSGFVWRVLRENGVLLKRTTARKLYFCLSPVSENEKWTFGNLVFFDDLKHCGIIAGPDKFYHSESSIGTNLSDFDPFWRPKIYGIRAIRSFPAADTAHD